MAEEGSKSAAAPLIALQGIGKVFPGVVANADVTLSVAPGEIHSLLGENGAGKSTLVKIIYGVLRPDSGAMTFEGAPYAPRSPAEARARGIGMVFQHFSLFEALSVVENIALGLAPEHARGDLAGRVAKVSASYGLKLDPHRLVGELSVGERQRVEIVRCLIETPRLLIMDEPTSVLTPGEVDELFAVLRRLKSEGRSVLYISHKLEEIRALCDHATVLRGGRVVSTCIPANETARSLAEMMIGASLNRPTRERHAIGAPRLKLDGLSVESDAHFGVDLQDLRLEVRGGEVIGIAGVAGNGQGELMEALIGERTVPAGQIHFDSAAIGDKGPNERRALGLAFVPEERLGHAAVPEMSLSDNTLISSRPGRGFDRRGFIEAAARDALASEIVDKFAVKTAGIGHAARSLSGGNLQKFVVGREIVQRPAVLIVAQPTWGVDAGATVAIHRALLDLAKSGTAVLVISQDLDELFAICDRIAVISHGRLTEARPIESLTVESIGVAMGGREPATAA